MMITTKMMKNLRSNYITKIHLYKDTSLHRELQANKVGLRDDKGGGRR